MRSSNAGAARPLPTSFRRTLDQLRSIAETEREKGALFERLMRKYFTEDPRSSASCM